jgi:undecaprenyl pyrophosphate synthase
MTPRKVVAHRDSVHADTPSEALRSRMQAASLRTAGNARLTLNACVGHGGYRDIEQAARGAAVAARAGELGPAAIDENTLAPYFGRAPDAAPTAHAS